MLFRLSGMSWTWATAVHKLQNSTKYPNAKFTLDRTFPSSWSTRTGPLISPSCGLHSTFFSPRTRSLSPLHSPSHPSLSRFLHEIHRSDSACGAVPPNVEHSSKRPGGGQGKQRGSTLQHTVALEIIPREGALGPSRAPPWSWRWVADGSWRAPPWPRSTAIFYLLSQNLLSV